MMNAQGMYMYLAPLTPASCKDWAAKAFWTHHEAILLSMGFSPDVAEDMAESKAHQIAIEYVKRYEIIERSQYGADKAPIKGIPTRYTVSLWEYESVFDPAPFTLWAADNFPCFHVELYKAVSAKYPCNFSALNLMAQKEGPLQRLDDSKSSNAREAAAAKWGGKYLLEAKIDELIEGVLIEGCQCGHATVAKTVQDRAWNYEPLIKGAKLDEDKLQNLVLKRCRKFFNEKKLGHRVVGSSGYLKSDQYCLIHDARK